MPSYELEPEVAGSLGPATCWDAAQKQITRLDFEFDDWLGDDLVTSTPVVLATARLCDAIADAGLTGVEFAPVTVSRSELFAELHGGELPAWVWLRVTGRREVDDFWTEVRRDLVVSERALAVARRFSLDRCIVRPASRAQE